jgi:hypothetical protein
MLGVVALALLALTSEGLAQSKLPRVGVLTAGPATGPLTARWLAVFRRALAAEGWVEGQTVVYELRNVGGDPARFAEVAA